MDTAVHIPARLKDYIDETLAPLPPVSDPDQPLHIDSLALIRLVAFMENELGIQVQDEDLLAENFATLRSLSRLIASRETKAGEGDDRDP